MISVVCVYNNERTFKNVLLKSLENQTVGFELIALDNREGRYRSAAEALNYGGEQAKGDYIMFVHQDMWLASDSWLEDVERMVRSLPSLGVAGVAGMSSRGKDWWQRVRFSINIFDEDRGGDSGRVTQPEEVQTLDECLLIVPRSVFDRIKFDEKVFDGWDCYGADYCLCARGSGLKVYVIPAPSSHCCLRACYSIWQFKGLHKYQKRLYEKHKKSYGCIHTWMGDVSWLSLKLRSVMGIVGPVYLRLFPDIFSLMRKELAGCDKVLDLGCGHHSPLQVCNVPQSVGVELFEPSLQESRRLGIHSGYIKGDVRRIAFKPRSFDAVMAVEVLEHLTKDEGTKLLSDMEQWTKGKVVVTTPNGYLRQDSYGGNPLQVHRSGWNVDDFKALGFKVRGVAGWRGLRGEKGRIKYNPAFLWERVSDMTQTVVYHFPRLAFQLMAVKEIKGAK